jgi:hypothetical protein
MCWPGGVVEDAVEVEATAKGVCKRMIPAHAGLISFPERVATLREDSAPVKVVKG